MGVEGVLRFLNVALVEDRPEIREALRSALGGHLAATYTDALGFREEGGLERAFDLVLLDLMSPRDSTGAAAVALIPDIRARFPRTEIVVQSGVDSIETMRACLRAGAHRYVLKDAAATEIPLLLASTLDRRTLARELDETLVGDSEPLRRLKDELVEWRRRAVDVLVEGETGTGKELVARFLKSDGPWVAVNAAAIPHDLFESEFFGSEKGAFTGAAQARAGHLENANGGTLFIDEIQSLSLEHQAKVLRVLETRKFTRVGSSSERTFRGRIVAAANTRLREAADRGAFREDLYYRLSGVSLRMPPLRARRDDIPALVAKFLADDGLPKLEILPDALEWLAHGYDWPGNVRELRNFVRTSALKARMPRMGVEEVKAALAPEDDVLSKIQPGAFELNPLWTFDEGVTATEKALIERALEGRTPREAMGRLKMSKSRFYEKMAQYGLRRSSEDA